MLLVVAQLSKLLCEVVDLIVLCFLYWACVLSYFFSAISFKIFLGPFVFL